MPEEKSNKSVVYGAKKRNLADKISETAYITNAQKKLLQKLNSNNGKEQTSLNTGNNNISR